MRLRQIEYFVAVCDAGSFTAAAARLLVAQPSLSQQVRALEAELGATLIERSRHGIELTDAGRVFLDEVKAILLRVENAKQLVRDVTDGKRGDLHVLTVRSVASGVLPPSVVRWHAKYPETVLRMHDFSHRRDLEEAMRLGRGDVAVGPRPPNWDGPVLSLGYEELRVVGAPEGPSDKVMRADELANADWIAFEPEQGMSEVLDRIAGRLGFTPRVVARTGQVAAAVHLAVEGIGLTVVPENAIPIGWSSRMRRLGQCGTYRELVAYMRASPSSMARRYVASLGASGLPLLPARRVPEDAIRF